MPIKEYINGIFVAVCVPIAQQAEQVVVLARLSLSLCLWFNTEGSGLGGRGGASGRFKRQPRSLQFFTYSYSHFELHTYCLSR
jgi:hypothetical protein